MSKTRQITGLVMWLALCSLLPGVSVGAEVSGLYEAELLVFSQRTDERAEVMDEALAQVLIKASGRASTTTVEGVRAALSTPASYLQLYRYRQLTEVERKLLTARLEVEQPEQDSRSQVAAAQMVSFRFDKAAVDKLLQANGIPIWGATRPSTLVWLAIQQDDRRYLLSHEEGDSLRDILRSAARERGLALLLPLMDLQDQAGLRFADVWGGFPEPVIAASQRYQSESVLMGRLYLGFGNQWQGQWTLIEGGRSQSWSVEAAQQAEVLRQGIAGAAETLAGLYAPVLSQQQAGLMPVLVTRITSAVDYSRVMDYLQSLQAVARVMVEEVNPDQVFFQLDIKGNAAGLAKTIGLGNVLVPDQEAFIASRQMPAGNDGLSFGADPRSALQVYRLIP